MSSRDSIGELIALASVESDGSSSDELRGELELLAGKAALKRSELAEAGKLLESASAHLIEPVRQRELAAQILLLVRTWGKRKETPVAGPSEEHLLRIASDLDPVHGLPSRARYLQQSGRLQDAATAWRDAIIADPGQANHYLNLARVYEQAGEPELALGTYLESTDAAPSARNTLTVAQRLDAIAPDLPKLPAKTIKLALLGNATLDHLQSYLKVECYRAGLQAEVYVGGFDQYTQDILNPESGLYEFAPEVVICAVHASRLFPHIHHDPFGMALEERQVEIHAGLAELQNLLDTLTDRSSALVLLHTMVAPQFPALGILDWRDDHGQVEMFGEINARLAALVREHYKSVYLLDEDRIQSRAGKARATDVRLWLTARIPWSDDVLSGLAREYVRYLIAYKGLTRKCVVLDLDNTLWGGIIGEDGVGGIHLGSDAPGNGFVAFQRELERLWRRGVLLAVCSKNNEEDVLPVFEAHPDMVLKLSHLAARRINWRSKAENIREIAKDLNIGLDSLVFLDDNPVERARVRAELPQVLTPELPIDPAYYRSALLELGVFDTLALTDEDRRRNQLYAEQAARRDLETRYESAGSLDAYLAALEMVVEIEPVSQQTLPRIAQLTTKTNQFNLTTRRYSEGQLSEMANSGCRIYGMRVRDRFGDNGLVGVALLSPRDADTWEIDTLLLSCRVMGRGVETALLAFLANWARQQGASHLQGWYLPTSKNSPVEGCYRDHGFALLERSPEGGELWELNVGLAGPPVPGWLTVHTPLDSAPLSSAAV